MKFSPIHFAGSIIYCRRLGVVGFVTFENVCISNQRKFRRCLVDAVKVCINVNSKELPVGVGGYTEHTLIEGANQCRLTVGEVGSC